MWSFWHKKLFSNLSGRREPGQSQDFLLRVFEEVRYPQEDDVLIVETESEEVDNTQSLNIQAVKESVL